MVAKNPMPKLSHVFDDSFASYPRLRKLADEAAEFLDEDSEKIFPATAVWSVNSKSKEIDPTSRSEFADHGPICLLLRDDELGVEAKGYLKCVDIEGDSRHFIRSLWGKLTWARIDKLHEIADCVDGSGESKS
jgi:hypothetical protein